MFEAEDDDGVSTVLHVQLVDTRGLKHAVRLLERAVHGEREGEDLVAGRMLLAGEYVVAVRGVQSGFRDDLRAAQPFLVKELLQVVGEVSMGDLVLARELCRVGRRQKLFEKLVCQRLFHAPFPSPSLFLDCIFHSIANGMELALPMHQLRANEKT